MKGNKISCSFFRFFVFSFVCQFGLYIVHIAGALEGFYTLTLVLKYNEQYCDSCQPPSFLPILSFISSGYTSLQITVRLGQLHFVIRTTV